MKTHFTKNLIQAISDWQKGGNSGEKRQRGLALEAECKSLPDKYRQCGMVAFRRLALKKRPLWRLMIKARLSERISAWTLTTDVAKTFKNGVPPPKWQGVILHHLPTPDTVIVNLPVLFADSRFQAAVTKYKSRIRDFNLGMGRYQANQSEVIIKRAFVTPEEIYALGGYSSQPEKLGKLFFGGNVTPAQMAWMRTQLQGQAKDFGKWWIEGAAKDRVLTKVKAETPDLIAKQKRQLAAKRLRKRGKNKC